MFRLRVRSVDARSEGQPGSCPYNNIDCRLGPIVDVVERGFQSGEGYQVLRCKTRPLVKVPETRRRLNRGGYLVLTAIFIGEHLSDHS